jgi:DNA invertase Pin-like site-specific DNA recombinase
MKDQPRVASYLRVSTTDKQSPEMQLREAEEFCERRGWKPETFVDRVSSGKVRPELERMLQLCRHRKFDVVVVYRFDRFARSSMELLSALEEFRALGIDFISLHENIDTTTPQGKLMFAIVAAFAEFEREIIRERVRSGLAAARARGKVFGRPRTQVDLNRVAQLRQLGRSYRQIGSEMGLDPTLVCRALARSNHPSETQVVSACVSVPEQQRVCA